MSRCLAYGLAILALCSSMAARALTTAEAESGLVGMWLADLPANQGRPVKGTYEFMPQHKVTLQIETGTAGASEVIAVQGRWSVDNDVISIEFQSWDQPMPMADAMKQPDRNRIVSLSAAELVIAPLAGQGRNERLHRVAAAAPGAVKILLDDTFDVAAQAERILNFTLPQRAQVAMLTESSSPIDILVLPFKTTESRYETLKVSVEMNTGEAQKQGNEARSDDPVFRMTTAQLFAMPLARKEAAGRRQSPYVTLDAGTYSVVFDNSGDFTPTEGDASVRLQVLTKPSN